MTNDIPKLSPADHARSQELVQLDHDVFLDRWAAWIPVVAAALCVIRLSLQPTDLSIFLHLGLCTAAACLVALWGWQGLGYPILLQRQNRAIDTATEYDPHFMVMCLFMPLLAGSSPLDCLVCMGVLWSLNHPQPAIRGGLAALPILVYPPLGGLSVLSFWGLSRRACLSALGWLVGGLFFFSILILAWDDLRASWVSLQTLAAPSSRQIGLLVSLAVSALGCMIYFRLRRRDLMDPHPLMGQIPIIMLIQTAALFAEGRLGNIAWGLAAPALAITWDMIWPILPIPVARKGRSLCYTALAGGILYGYF